MSTDKDWERWGSENPYYGVYSSDQFLGKELDSESEERFYLSGEKNIEQLSKKIEKLYGRKKTFKTAVDFGSGVGRLSFALTKIADKVVGLDISPSMISTAKTQAKKRKVKNVKFVLTNDSLKGLPKSYGLVYSFITLQHISPKRGLKIIDSLSKNLDKGGCLALQVTYELKRSKIRKIMLSIRENVAPVRWLANIVKGRPASTPNMRMHSYPLSEVFNTLRNNGISNLNLEFTDHGGFLGVFIVGKK